MIAVPARDRTAPDVLTRGAEMNDLERQTIASRGDAACRYLALRVIEQAFRDLTSTAGTRADQESAFVFLAGSAMFYRWCEIADVSAAATIARATTLKGTFPPRRAGGMVDVASAEDPSISS